MADKPKEQETKAEEIKLPAYFDRKTAEGIVGKEKAEAFFLDVIAAAGGDKQTEGVDIQAGVNAVEVDPKNTVAKETLKRIEAVFKKAKE